MSFVGEPPLDEDLDEEEEEEEEELPLPLPSSFSSTVIPGSNAEPNFREPSRERRSGEAMMLVNWRRAQLLPKLLTYLAAE